MTLLGCVMWTCGR